MSRRSVLVTFLIVALVLFLYCKQSNKLDQDVPPPDTNVDSSEPEQLHSAAWVSGDVETGTAVDIDQLQTCLSTERPYLLKLALQDSPFALGNGEGTATGELSPIKPGTPLGITYLSDQLEPSFGSQILEAPARNETGLVSFPVRAAAGSRKRDIRVSLLISAGGVTFGRTALDLEQAPEDGVCAVFPGVETVQEDTHQIAPEAMANYLEAAAQESWISLIINPQGAIDPFRMVVNSVAPLRLNTSGDLQVTPSSLGGAMSGLREKLDDIRAGYGARLDAEVVDPGVREDLLRELAEEGHRLYNKLFPRQSGLRATLDRIRDYSFQHDAPLRIRIIHIGGRGDPKQPVRLLVPFGLLYDAPGFSLDQSRSAPVDPKGFWGARYLIEYEVEGMTARTGGRCGPDGIRLVAALDRKCTGNDAWCTLIRGQVDELQQLYREPQWVDDADSLWKVLNGDGDGEHDLLYYYGHTIGGPRPALKFRETQAGGFELGRFEDQSREGNFLRGNPVVFLNSCSSVNPKENRPGESHAEESYDTFLDMMARLQASAFIGTETAVRPAYASKVGRHLLRELAASRPQPASLGRVFWKIQRDTLESDTGNPMILIYSLLGDSLVRVCS